jgi:glycyl-tRNA synthetase beta chain
MAEFLLELFSEEIPARMQRQAVHNLSGALRQALSAPLRIGDFLHFFGPRRIAVRATVAEATAAQDKIERGPRLAAPEQALAGFLRKHNADRAQLRPEGDYWVLRQSVASRPAAGLIAEVLPPLLRRLPWPKSMRWGGSGNFTWVRPLRRILCLLDGVVVPVTIEEAGLIAGDLTEGHRILAPGAFAVRNAADWREGLRARFVLVDAGKRRARIAEGLAALAAARGLRVVEDEGLLDEVEGLVEWPVPLLGRIDADFMTLPPEVRQVSMRVNQRYFALCDSAGDPAPWFGFAANIEGTDGGAAIIAGNERVLRARLADARHFWDADRRVRLEDRLPALDRVVFHAKLGSQGARAQRIVALAAQIAPLVRADVDLARRAGLLAKADLPTGMVGEFPELQGVMGRYYALHDGEAHEVADAIRDHYKPRGPSEDVPMAPVSIAVALADKLDTLAGFFAIGEAPTGSGDPYALRRAALGVIRVVLDNCIRADLYEVIWHALRTIEPSIEQSTTSVAVLSVNVYVFLRDRMRQILEEEGFRHDIISAGLAVRISELPDANFVRLRNRVAALEKIFVTEGRRDLLSGYSRAANILRIEDNKNQSDALFGLPDSALYQAPEEKLVANTLSYVTDILEKHLSAENFVSSINDMTALNPPLAAFFEHVMVNAPEPALRRNRLRLLRQVRDTMNRIADFSQIVDG